MVLQVWAVGVGAVAVKIDILFFFLTGAIVFVIFTPLGTEQPATESLVSGGKDNGTKCHHLTWD